MIRYTYIVLVSSKKYVCDARKIGTVKSTFILICILDANKCLYCIPLQSTIKAHCLSHSHKPTWSITTRHLTFWELRIWKKKYKRLCYSKYLSVLKRQIFLWSLLNEFKSNFLIWNCLRVDIKCVLQYCMIMWVLILYANNPFLEHSNGSGEYLHQMLTTTPP